MAKAKDLMTTQPLTVGSGDEIGDVALFFNENRMTSAPVMTPLGEVLGLLTEMTLLKAVVVKNATKKQIKIVQFQDEFDQAVFVNENDKVSVVLKTLMLSATHRVLVQNKVNKIIGIISPKDLLQSLSGEMKMGQTVMEELRSLHEELDDLKEKLKDMSSYLEIYDNVFQTGIYMLHSVDKTGKIILANDKLHEVLGYEKGELLERTIYDLYPRKIHHLVKAGLKKIMEVGKHALTYSTFLTQKGEQIRVDVASAAIKDENGRFIGTFTISRKIESEHLLRSLHGLFKDDEIKEMEANKADHSKNDSKVDSKD